MLKVPSGIRIGEYIVGIFLNLKRNKIEADLYYNGKKIATLKVNDRNPGNRATLSLDCEKDLRFKIVKLEENLERDENKFNSELYNI